MKKVKTTTAHPEVKLAKPDKGSIGRAGEFLVAYELERHGFTAAALFANAKDFDILAIDKNSGEEVAVQVKTSWGATRKWVLTEKAEGLARDNVFYFFVSLNGGEAPALYIVPSATVADAVKKDHQGWLRRKGRDGTAHQDSRIRNFRIEKDELPRYLGNWNALRGRADEAVKL